MLRTCRFLKMSLAKWDLVCRAGRAGLLCWCSFSEDVPSENVIFKIRGRKHASVDISFFEDVSGETLIFHARVKFATFILWGMSQAKRLFL